MAFSVDYDFDNGWVFEKYEVISINHMWSKVRLTHIEVWQRCECEDRPNCHHTIISMGNGEEHPALPGRGGVGSTYNARLLKGLHRDENEDEYYQHLRIYTAKNISCVGKRIANAHWRV